MSQRPFVALKPPDGNASGGFTLIELIVVIILMAILMATAAPRFLTPDNFEGPAFAQELASAARYAQKLAVASGCPVQFVVTAANFSLNQPLNQDCTGGFSRAVTHPATGNSFTASAPNGVAIAGDLGTVEFNARGVPDAAASLTVSGRTVAITAGSGYVEVQ